MNIVIKKIIGVLLLMFSTASFAENEYYIDFGDGYTYVKSPSSKSCDIGKIFDKKTKEWRCATISECPPIKESSMESSICNNYVRNIMIRSNGSMSIYGAYPGSHP